MKDMDEERSGKKWIAFFAAGAIVVVGVFTLWGGDESTEYPSQNEARAEVLVYRDAYVNEINVGVSSAGVAVVAHGILSDPCTKVNDVMQDYDGKQFYVTILSARPEGAVCSQMIIPFEQIIPLENATALTPGTYSVDVNGISKTFSVQ